MKIDSHQHFWRYTAEEYGWISEEVIRRDFVPADLKPLLDESRIDGVIAVQARTSEGENDFLLACAEANDWIKAVVGYADLTRPDIEEALAVMAAHPKLRGVREVLQGMGDDAFCLRDDFNRGISSLRKFGLVYDILIYQRQLGPVIEFVDLHPDQIFVLDHVAKPVIALANPDKTWAEGIAALGERENVYCKLSGMVTEVASGQPWNAALLKPYFETVLDAFGAERILFGSDWPVCLMKATYVEWVSAVEGFVADMSSHEQAAIWGGNAAKVYGI